MRDAFAQIVGCLEFGVPVSLSRWGDGEWHALLGHRGKNCDGQVYTATLGAELSRVLMDRPRYLLGLQPLVRGLMGPDVLTWLAARHLRIEWVDGDCFVHRSMTATLGPFLQALAGRRIVLVGPAYLEPLRLFPILQHVLVPMRHAVSVWRSLVEDLTAAITAQRADVVLVSAGMSSNLIIHALADSHPTVSALDMGSLWEPYVGQATRSYHAAILAREQARAHKGAAMFSIRQKREIAAAVHRILRETNHPELPTTEIQFRLEVQGAEPWSFAEIRNNGAVETPDMNPWNEAQDPRTQ